MKYKRFSHNSGHDEVPAAIAASIETALSEVNRPLKIRAAANIRQDILSILRNTAGWSDAVRISSERGLTLTARNGKIGLCLQTGNMARFYADLLKLQAQFANGNIASAVYILPTQSAAKTMGDNLANFERLTGELTRVFSKVITVPLLVYGFYAEMEGE